MAASSAPACKCTTSGICFSMCQQVKKPCAIFGGGSATQKGPCSMPALLMRNNPKLALKGLHLVEVRAERSRGCDMRVENSLAEHVQVMRSAEEGTQQQQDWRAFRAALISPPLSPSSSTHATRSRVPSIWAHKLVRPEEGCLLMATHHLDTHPLLQKSLVLLTKAPRQRDTMWTGHLINKPLPYPIAGVVGISDDVALGLAQCPAFLGGSLLATSASSIHSITASPLCGHHPLLPGLHIGSGDSALLAAWAGIRQQMITPSQVRVLVGQLEWDVQTLAHEVEVLEWWSVVSCHASFLLPQDVNCMWGTLHSLLEA